jgi:Fe-S cluster assembly protein SufD
MPISAKVNPPMLNALAHFEQQKPHLSGDIAARAAALQQAETMGLPTRRSEPFHYTDLSRLLKNAPANQAANQAAKEAPLLTHDFSACKALYVSFHDGVLSRDSGSISGDFAAIQAPDAADVMGLYNQALAQTGLTLDLDKNPQGTVIVETTGDQPQHLKHRIKVAAGVQLTLIDDHAATGYANVSWELVLGENANVTFVQMQQAGQQVAMCDARLGADAKLTKITLLSGAELARHATHIRLESAGAQAQLHSAVLGRGASHSDVTYVIDHQSCDTQSHTSSHQALGDRARGVFQGKVIVQRDAQRVDAQMQARAMMLSEGAEMDAKPELEIYADDVVCAHGTAIGEIDAEALFFLRSRGLDEATARQLLIGGFIEQVLGHCDDPVIADVLRGHIEHKIAALMGGKTERRDEF